MYVRVSLKHLWGAVLQRATEIVEELPWSHHGSGAKVYQPDVEALINDDVLILYVPVKDVFGPQIEDSCHQLGTDTAPGSHTEDPPETCVFYTPVHTCLKM